MKSLIKIRRIRFFTVAISFSILCGIGTVAAQQKASTMAVAEKVETMSKMSASSDIVPQNPEDISPLLYGEKIPKAVLMDPSGKSVDLNKAVAEKPTILVFYRGGWCPYCSKQLSSLQAILPELERMGYQLMAISTDTPDGLKQSMEKEKLGYTLLSDANLQLAKQFGIAYKAPKAYWDMLAKSTGGKDVDLLLPVPSVFIVDKTGTIQFEYINPDFKQRLNADLLNAAATSIRKSL